jgi:hypothetical protein
MVMEKAAFAVLIYYTAPGKRVKLDQAVAQHLSDLTANCSHVSSARAKNASGCPSLVQ